MVITKSDKGVSHRQLLQAKIDIRLITTIDDYIYSSFPVAIRTRSTGDCIVGQTQTEFLTLRPSIGAYHTMQVICQPFSLRDESATPTSTILDNKITLTWRPSPRARGSEPISLVVAS